MILLDEQLRIYCGMTVQQADAFLDLYDGKVIHFNQFMSFAGAGLVVRRSDPTDQLAHVVTNAGFFILARINSIKKKIYQGAKPSFTPEELHTLSENTTHMARMQLPRTRGLLSAHMKALTATARNPGIVMRSLLMVYSPETVATLIAKDLVGCTDAGIDPGSKYLPLYPLTQGLSMLNWCLNQLKMVEGE